MEPNSSGYWCPDCHHQLCRFATSGWSRALEERFTLLTKTPWKDLSWRRSPRSIQRGDGEGNCDDRDDEQWSSPCLIELPIIMFDIIIQVCCSATSIWEDAQPTRVPARSSMLSDSDDQVCYLMINWSFLSSLSSPLIGWLIDLPPGHWSQGFTCALGSRWEEATHICFTNNHWFTTNYDYDCQGWLQTTMRVFSLANHPPPRCNTSWQRNCSLKRWLAYIVLLTMIVLRNLVAIMMAIDSFSMSYVKCCLLMWHTDDG